MGTNNIFAEDGAATAEQCLYHYSAPVVAGGTAPQCGGAVYIRHTQ